MVILLTGAGGFIGSNLARGLEEAGHEVVRVGRSRPRGAVNGRFVRIDYARAPTVCEWLPYLAGVDVAVNAAGILRERGRQTFDVVHAHAPRALFAACAIGGVRVVQISALGADTRAENRYFTSKAEADDFALQVCPRAVVAQPSLVYGADGTSARLFTMLAGLPFVPLPGAGEARIQPIHIDDLVQALVNLVERDTWSRCKMPLTGPVAMTLAEFLAELRRSMALPRGRYVRVPWSVMEVVARVAARIPRSLLDAETLAMLRAGSVADPAATAEILGRPPRAPSAFIPPHEASAARVSATLGWALPALRAAIAAVWIGSGIVSLGIYPVEDSYAMLERAGISGPAAPAALYGAALLDIAFGVGTLALRQRRWLWILQAIVIVAYTCIITVALPEYWLHPYGPVLKNLPLLVAILMLHQLERR